MKKPEENKVKTAEGKKKQGYETKVKKLETKGK